MQTYLEGGLDAVFNGEALEFDFNTMTPEAIKASLYALVTYSVFHGGDIVNIAINGQQYEVSTDEIAKIVEENPNLTIISITHDIEEAYNSDEVIILNDGELYMQGKPSEVFKDDEKMEQIDLDLPFITKLKKTLVMRNVDVSDAKTLEEMVIKLCQ